MFPSLVNCCTIDWFEKWPEDALLSVAENSLNDIGHDDIIQNLSIVCVALHRVWLLKIIFDFSTIIKMFFYRVLK